MSDVHSQCGAVNDKPFSYLRIAQTLGNQAQNFEFAFAHPVMSTICEMKQRERRFKLAVFKMDLPEQGFWHEHLAYKAMLDCQVQRLRDLAIRSKSRIFGYKFQN